MTNFEYLVDSRFEMIKFAVLCFTIVCCSAFNLNSELDESNGDRVGQFTEDYNKLESRRKYSDAEFEDDEFEEIEAIHRHVKYQDKAREALLKLAAELRKGKNVSNAFLKVIDGFEKGIAEFHSALRGRTLKTDTIENIKNFIKEGTKDRAANTKILRELTSQGLFVSERLGEIRNEKARSKRADFLDLGAAEFLSAIKNDIGEKQFEEYLSISGLVTLIFVIDDTGSMGSEIKSAVAISKEIINAKRDYDVDYILSPFNDPG